MVQLSPGLAERISGLLPPQCWPKVYVCCVLYVVMGVEDSLECNFLVLLIPLSSGLGWGRCCPTLILTRPVFGRKGGLLPQILIRTVCLNSRRRGAVRSVVPPPFLVSLPSTPPQELSCLISPALLSLDSISLTPTMLLCLSPPPLCLRGAGRDRCGGSPQARHRSSSRDGLPGMVTTN